jgi:hypothetical protein
MKEFDLWFGEEVPKTCKGSDTRYNARLDSSHPGDGTGPCCLGGAIGVYQVFRTSRKLWRQNTS